MSFVSVEPAEMAAGAASMLSLGSAMTGASAAAAAPTMGIVPPGMEETSALLALSLSTHGAIYQAAAMMADVFHQLAAMNLAANGVGYEAVDAVAATGALL
ncbi:MAG: hypothetical protein QG597_3790 [Actinomycetota bacterium]|mgnify:CR=1 FL=1|nr:hypothetical protein [Actinomycetota bacterium]